MPWKLSSFFCRIFGHFCHVIQAAWTRWMWMRKAVTEYDRFGSIRTGKTSHSGIAWDIFSKQLGMHFSLEKNCFSFFSAVFNHFSGIFLLIFSSADIREKSFNKTLVTEIQEENISLFFLRLSFSIILIPQNHTFVRLFLEKKISNFSFNFFPIFFQFSFFFPIFFLFSPIFLPIYTDL